MSEASISLTIGKLSIQGLVGTNEASSSGSKSWLVAIAQALGQMLGEKAETMKGLVDKMNAAEDSGMEFNTALTEFQAESQMFSMLSNASSTAIKSIGEGLTSNARKQ